MNAENIRVMGPREGRPSNSVLCVNTTSRSTEVWSRGLSPFYLGPVPLYAGKTALNMENAWQYAKVYPEHRVAGEPSPLYWEWAGAGWASRRADRYPMGKGAKPAYCYWDGEKLGYIEARKRVYFPLYRDAVKKTEAFAQLSRLAANQEVALWDFDGYDHDSLGMTLAEVLNNDQRPMGHAFLLKAMLVYGPEVTVEVIGCSIPKPITNKLVPQASLFDCPRRYVIGTPS